MKSFEYSIPKEIVEDRPEVFSRKSFPAVIRLARRFHRLLTPVTGEEAQLYREKYGEAPAAISPRELENVQSLSDVRLLVEERTGVVVRKELGEVLKGAETAKEYYPTKGGKSLWKGSDSKAILDAAADKKFDGIGEGRNDLEITALAVSLIAERARTNTMGRALKALPEAKLAQFGMSHRQREIIVGILRAMTKVNAEYMRLQLHVREDEPLPARPKDTVRERKFIAQQFSEIMQMIERLRGGDRDPIFGSNEKDETFLAYLNALKEAYRAFEENGSLPLSRREQQERMEKAQGAFLSLHTKFPDFPLIVFPAFSHYGSDDAVEGSRRSWRSFGFDPEIRLYWQTKEQREKQKLYHRSRDHFADKIEERYPGLADTDTVRQYRALIGEPIAASGINIKEMTTSQEERNIILMTESRPNASDREAELIFETHLENEDDLLIARNPAFQEMKNKRVALHEFGHGLYSEMSVAADALGGYDDQLAELKSDLAMWVVAGKVLREDAERDFGGKSLRAIQLSMIADAIGTYQGIGRADSAYALAAQRVLEVLHEEDVFTESNGKLVIDTARLDQDLGPAFEGKLKEILEIYDLASQGSKESVAKARSGAKRIIGLRPEKFLSGIRGQA